MLKYPPREEQNNPSMVPAFASRKSKLTPRQELFVIEYAKDFNATQAAIRAGYSRKNADQIGPRLVWKCKDIIEERKSEVMKRAGDGIATLEQTLRLATSIAFGDIRTLFDTHGNCREIPELTEEQQRCIAGFEIEDLYEGKGKDQEKMGYVRKYRLPDRSTYVNMLLKFHGAFSTKPKETTPQRSRYDLSKLTDGELQEHMRLARKALIQQEGVQQ